MTRYPESTTEIRVRYAETDQMGVAYHTNYLVWCEIGRTEYMRDRGVPYAELERDGVFLVVAEAQIRFVAPVRYDDRVQIRTRLERVQSRAVTFAYDLGRDAGGQVARVALARTTLVATDRTGAVRTLPESFFETVRGLEIDTP